MTNEEKPKCKVCGSTNIALFKYDARNPEHYDGWSEIYCLDCGKRFGRWSGLELKDGELEKLTARYAPVKGGSKPITPDREFEKLKVEKNGKIYEYDREGFQPID